MKTRILICNSLFLLFFQISIQAQQISFFSIEDTYVDSSSPTTVYGTEDKLLVKASTNGNFDRKIFLKFDITGSTTNYDQVVLKLVKHGGEELNVISVPSTSTQWSESSMNWNNAPDLLGERSQGHLRIADTLLVDVTDYVKQKIDNSQFNLSLAITTTDIIGVPFSIYSKEATLDDRKPKLIFYETQEYILENISLSKYISSDMIIQRGQPFPFRGQGQVGENITIDFVREGVHYYANGNIDAQGEFNISIPALEATSSPCNATISYTNYPGKDVLLENILIGDVWFAGGQSNMEKKVDHLLEASTVIPDADNYTNIRAFRASYNSVFDPKDSLRDINGSWIVCNTANVDKVSAVAYMFAKKVYQETGIPIGLMQSYRGGTEIETWISEDKIVNDPNLQFIENRLPGYDENDSNWNQKYPSVNYNGMVNPLRFYPITGFLFYQGESNVKRAPEYATLLRSLIENYREKWNLGNLPFYFVQLFNIGIASDRNYETTADNETWQTLREQQYLVAEESNLENIGMAVTIDTNEERLNPDINIRIHPRNKKPIGERLALIALKEVYSKNIIAYSPFVDDFWVNGSTVYIQMKNVGAGLKVRDNESNLVGFAIGNKEGDYFTADATIEGVNLISVQSNNVLDPKFVAYGWSRDPLCTLDNSADLPASPFRINLNSLNINDQDYNSTRFVVYPNPVENGIIKIYFKDDNPTTVYPKIRMLDLLGKEFSVNSIKKGNEYQIDIKHVSSGAYLLILETKGKIFHKKIIIK